MFLENESKFNIVGLKQGAKKRRNCLFMYGTASD